MDDCEFGLNPPVRPHGVARRARSLVDLLRNRAFQAPGQTAFCFLQDGEEPTHAVSYRDLDLKARAVAAALQERLAQGERALLLYPPGPDFIAAFFGCLYAGVVAVPSFPPRPHEDASRMRRLATDAGASCVLLAASIERQLERVAGAGNALRNLWCLSTDDIADDLATSWAKLEVTGERLALLQYTSGSTGAPKGVMVSHDNLLHNLETIHQRFEHSSRSCGVVWLPPYHDMGLVGGILQPIYGGFPVMLMPPASFVQKPIRWLRAVSRFRATTSGGPNFAYDLCARKIGVEQCVGLDLSCWNVAFNGAERIRPDTLDRFTAAFAPFGFRRDAFFPCYGMAESTLFVSGRPSRRPPAVLRLDEANLSRNRVVEPTGDSPALALADCGMCGPGQQLLVVDPESKTRCAPDRVGEIWLAGPSVARGYWNRPDATAATFNAFLADEPAGPFLRTGDLGFVHDGQLFVTGRLDDLIVVRGRNVYPSDVESAAERAHQSLRPGRGAAFSIDGEHEQQLVLVLEAERRHLRTVNAAEVLAAVRAAVARQCELHVHTLALIKPGGVPTTTSGKVQRRACRDAYLAGTLEPVTPTGEPGCRRRVGAL